MTDLNMPEIVVSLPTKNKQGIFRVKLAGATLWAEPYTTTRASLQQQLQRAYAFCLGFNEGRRQASFPGHVMPRLVPEAYGPED